MTARKGRSRLQKAAALATLAHINSSKKENIPPAGTVSAVSTPPSSHKALLADLKAEKTRSSLYQNRSYQLTRRLNRLNASKQVTLHSLEGTKADFASKLAEAANTIKDLNRTVSVAEEESEELQTLLSHTQADLTGKETQLVTYKKRVHKLRMQTSRLSDSQSRAVQSAVAKVSTERSTFKLKEKGVITAPVRALTRELVHLGIPVAKIGSTIHTTAKTFGIPIEGSLTTRSVSRIMLEGGIAAEMQIIDEIHKSKGVFLLFGTFNLLNKLSNCQRTHLRRMVPHTRTRTMRAE